MNFQVELQALLSLRGLTSLVILSILEVILGIDNIIFISLVLTKVPEEKRFNTRATALSLAFVMRIIMLFCLVWLSHITTTLFSISTFQVTIRDVLFLIGGAYLIYNTLKELLRHQQPGKRNATYKSIILQIVLVDMLFSFDSIFTAIGINPNILIMTLAVGIGMICMTYISGKTSAFIEKNPTIKTFALLFILAVGISLLAEAMHIEIPKTYLYSLFGSIFVVERLYKSFKKSA